MNNYKNINYFNKALLTLRSKNRNNTKNREHNNNFNTLRS